jgi:hypothetical protein
VRATFNDELMREAGFESDYYAELERRREHRRRKLKVDLLRAVRALAVVTVLLTAVVLPLLDILRAPPLAPRVPHVVFVVLVLPVLVGGAADFLLDRMRGEGEPKGLLRRFVWRCYRAGVRAWKPAAHRLESEA